jgi:hypothetical protein
MNNLGATQTTRGIGAGFIATIVLSAIMVMKQKMGLMPQLNPIEMITQMMGAHALAVGWSVHFFIGTILWGAIYTWFDPRLLGPYWFRGAIFATGAWLIMMIVIMPMAGAGLFGLKIGVMAPVAALVLHWIYGAVLGSLFGAAVRHEQAQPAYADKRREHAHRPW